MNYLRILDSSVTLWIIGVVFMVSASISGASEKPSPVPLPNPLSLKQAIELARQDHPELEIATSNLDKRKAQLQRSQSSKGFNLSLNGAVQSVDQVGVSGQQDDSYATILLSKSLYDFGKTGNNVGAARARLEGEWLRFFDARQRQRLKIMALFFDVMLADLRYRVDNETMARVYVTYDKIRERHKLGQYSDVQLLEYESSYRTALSKRVNAQALQRTTRARLAIGMNRPDDLADTLTPPILDDLDRKLPDYDEQVKKVLANNPVLMARKLDVVSAEKLVRSASATTRPELKAELEASQFQRPMGMRNDSRVGLVMQWPIYRGGYKGARVVEADALLREKRALYRKAEMDLKQDVLELLQRIELLQYRRKETQTLLEFRDLQLDQSRALYELEARATLGDAMIGVTEAQWKAAKVNYELALAWAELKAMSGELVEKTAEEKYR